jgi:anti-anti-sigma factor
MEDSMVAPYDSTPCGDVVLDFSAVTILTGATLGKLVRLHKKLREKGQALVLRNVNDTLYEILEVTGLTKIITVYAMGTNRLAGLD